MPNSYKATRVFVNLNLKSYSLITVEGMRGRNHCCQL